MVTFTWRRHLWLVRRFFFSFSQHPMTPLPLLRRSATTAVKRIFVPAALRAFAFLLLLATAVGVHTRAADAPATGTISGTVGNKMTGNLLEGARVELPALNRSALVDHTGHYVIENVPAGMHEIAASYV